ncbi:class I SAM-dependent methyltransferase [Thioalkalivibrio sp. ALJ16]|uniref:class I SAM-dependent methyltransferase n=1 Tax=Thioalkalivibrio sp. ALJ16 TaxID=1158762 RepID=UPI00035C6AF4|nr:class I SAM-dependent methyltransferase [Thioalkalivibrio sp. ALJ16]
MTETFDPDWLQLREPADHAARPEALATALREALAGAGSAVIRVTDLGSGTGSNLRYLAPRLPRPQHWRLVDHDAGLLAQALAPCAGVEIERQRCDLASDPAVALAGDEALVTGSALLDLVSREWLQRLLAACSGQGAAVLFALSYDGRMRWSRPHPLDADVEAWVNRHQRSDKGFGPALGPAAAATCAEQLEALGYRVQVAASDWRIGVEQAALGAALIEGWVGAAAAIRPERAGDLQAWGDARAQALAAGTVELTVGHQDVLGWR